MAAVAAGACSSEHVRVGGKHLLPATPRDAAVTGVGKSASSSFAVLDDVASMPRSPTRQTTTDADAMLHGPLPGSQIPSRLASQATAGGTLGRITKGGAQASLLGAPTGRAAAPPTFSGSDSRGTQSCRRSRNALMSFGADGCAGRHSRAPGRKRPAKRGADAQKRSSGSRGQRNALPRRVIRQRQLNVKVLNMAGLSEDKYNLMLDDVVPGTDVLFVSELGNSKGEAVYPALAAASGGSFITSDPPEMPSWAGLLASRDKPYREKIMAALSSKAGSSGCNKTPTQDNLARPARRRIPLAIECPCKQCALWALT